MTESPPTDTVPVAGATVEVVGQSSLAATTAADGAYQIANVPTGTTTVRASADDYEASDTTVALSSDRQLDFQLDPVFESISRTETDTIGTANAACLPSMNGMMGFHEGTVDLPDLPCRAYPVGVHHDGTLSASVAWSGFPNQLALIVLNTTTGEVVEVAHSDPEIPNAALTAPVAGGRSYMVAVLYNPQSQGESPLFMLTLTHPN